MRKTFKKDKELKINYHMYEFFSISDFINYLKDKPLNAVFAKKYGEMDNAPAYRFGYDFTMTNSFEEAEQMLREGWPEIAKRLNKEIKKFESESLSVKKRMMNKLDVCGGTPIVPLALAGVPDNMMQIKMVSKKQKVFVINKNISYGHKTTINQIVNESIKALQIIRSIEAHGGRCELNIIIGVASDHLRNKTYADVYTVKIRVKNAGERLIISKLAFPLVHPSMLRRFFLKFIETEAGVSVKFAKGHGAPMVASWLGANVYTNEYNLPAIFNENENITGLKSLEKFIVRK